MRLPICALLIAFTTTVLPSAALAADARALHERLLTLDTHLDTPANFSRPAWSITDGHTWDGDFSQVDLPRMIEGGLDGGFFAIFTGQGPRTQAGNNAARDAALMRGLQIREMVARHSDRFELAFRADDAARIAASGKRVVYQSMENAYPIGWDLSLMKTFYDLGVRMISPVHFSNNDLADSATDPNGKEWKGLSPLGKEFVAAANRLGMVLDASHASDDVLDQMVQLSSTPIILSHSGARAVFNHPRNLDDERLMRLAASGGVIQMNSLSGYLITTPANPERDAAFRNLAMTYGPFRQLQGARLAAYAAERNALEARYPVPRARLDDFMAHVLHALKLVGPEHVGIGLDWDGGGGVTGLEDVADIPAITERLLAAGYNEADLQNIWSGNVLRLLQQAEAKAGR